MQRETGSKQAAGEGTEPSLIETCFLEPWEQAQGDEGPEKGQSGLGYQTCSPKLGLKVCFCHHSYSGGRGVRTGEFKDSLRNSTNNKKRRLGVQHSGLSKSVLRKKKQKVAALMAQQLKAQATLTKDLGSVPSTHVRQTTTTRYSSSRRSHTSSVLKYIHPFLYT